MNRTVVLCIATILLLPLFLAGCSREYRESRREIDRLYQLAEEVAEDRATALVAEKYGIEAMAQGHWVQATYDFFTTDPNPNVVVFLECEDKKFCAMVNLQDETVFVDNYQRETIDALLLRYFTELYGLPQPHAAEITFRLKSSPDYRTALPLEWKEKGFDHTNMVDVYVESQTAEELLAQIDFLSYHVAYLNADEPSDWKNRMVLASIPIQAEDWPVCEDGYVEWNLRLYDSPEAGLVDKNTQSPEIAGYRYFRQWRRTCLRHKGTKEQELSGESFVFDSLQSEGMTITSRLSSPIEDIVRISEREPEWSISWGGGDGSDNSNVQTYRLVSDLYEITQPSPDSSYAAVMYVPAAFTEQYENPLYILCRDKETGEVNVRTQIASQEALDALPADEHRRDYKIHSNGVCGMSIGKQYAVAEKIGDESE